MVRERPPLVLYTTPRQRLARQLAKRGFQLSDLKPCPLCRRSADLEPSSRDGMPICMNASCIYARAAARVAPARLSLVS